MFPRGIVRGRLCVSKGAITRYRFWGLTFGVAILVGSV